MKNILSRNTILFLGMASFLLFLSYAQTSPKITDELGGIPTSFQLTTNSIPFDVSEQLIIERAVSNDEKDFGVDYAYALGYGYEAKHLEFIAKREIITVYKYHNKRDKKLYVLEFYAENNEKLLTLELPEKVFTQYLGKENYISSLNLKDVPLIIIDKIRRIDITIQDFSRKHQTIFND